MSRLKTFGKRYDSSKLRPSNIFIVCIGSYVVLFSAAGNEVRKRFHFFLLPIRAVFLCDPVFDIVSIGVLYVPGYDIPYNYSGFVNSLFGNKLVYSWLLIVELVYNYYKAKV